MAKTAITPANAKTPAKENAANTIPVVANASEAPSESEIDSAEELKPWFSLVDSASVMTLVRGYMSPMPAPPEPQPTMATTGDSRHRAVAKVQRDRADNDRAADADASRVRQPVCQAALQPGRARPGQRGQRERQPGEGCRKVVVIDEQVRQVHLGAEERRGDDAAGEDDAR